MSKPWYQVILNKGKLWITLQAALNSNRDGSEQIALKLETFLDFNEDQNTDKTVRRKIRCSGKPNEKPRS